VVEFSERKTLSSKHTHSPTLPSFFSVTKQKPNTIQPRIRDSNGVPVVERMSKSADEEIGLESIRWCPGLLFGAPIGEVGEEEIPSVWNGLEDIWKKVEKLKDDGVGEREKNSRCAISKIYLFTHFFFSESGGD
jgi:hypothetical protein